MLKQSDINPDILNEALEDLKSIASNSEYSSNLLVLGSGKGSVADLYMSTDDEIVKINNEIDQHILGKE